MWRDEGKAGEAADALKITSASLLKLRVIDEVINEPVGGAHRDYEGTMKAMKKTILKHLERLEHMSTKKLLSLRFEKYSKIGRFR